MSNLNRAFIKAYGKQGAAGRPGAEGAGAPASAVPPAPHLPLAASQRPGPPPTPPAGALLELPTAHVPPPAPVPVAVFDAPHAAIPSPHVNFANPPAPAAPGPTGAPSTAELDRTASGAKEAPRLSVFPAPPATTWRPMFEVPNLAWPEIVARLQQASAAELSAAAAELQAGVRSHRGLVAVTAARGDQGCTTVAMTVARWMAHEDHKVVLVDAHFAAPQLAAGLGVVVQAGWEENLCGGRPLVETLVESLDDHLTLLLLGAAPVETQSLSFDVRLRAAFDELRRHFDLVVVDAGPLAIDNARVDLSTWARRCRVDRALVVRDARSIDAAELAAVESRLRLGGLPQWNYVDNFSAA